MLTTAISYKNNIRKFQSLMALMVLCIVLSFLTDKFFTAANGLNVLRQVAVNTCIATGMTLIVLTAGIDLSVGSVLALCGAISAGLLKNGIQIPSADLYIGFTILGAILVAIIAGSLMGLFNGFVITKFKVPPFVATLAMLTIARGFTMLYTEGHPISNLGEKFGVIGAGSLLGIPVPCGFAGLVVSLAVL
jgi:ribose transport system permease protein